MGGLASLRGNLVHAFEGGADTITAAANSIRTAVVNRYSWAEATRPADLGAASDANRRPVVRRPTMGLVGYEDRWATIEVVVRTGDSSQGEHVELFNSTYANLRAPVNTNFMVQRVDYRKMETAQVVRTFGDFYISDVGENPEVLKVQGILFESRNFPWLSEWKRNYNTYLRARQCILRRAMVYLTIDDTMYVGYIVNTNATRSTDVAWELVPFSFDMILRNVVEVRDITRFPDVTIDTPDPPILTPTQQAEWNNGDPFTRLSTAVTHPNGASLAQLAEIVDGRFEDQIVELRQPTLEFEGRLDEAVFRVNIDELVRVARAINAQTGRDFIDIQGLRSGYLAGRQAEFEAMGIPNPEVYGMPSRYQTEVDARRAGAREQYRSAIEGAFNDAKDEINSLGWF